MGWRYRKSVKIAPGVKLNFGKKSMGVSIGGKHGGVSINSKSGVTARTSIPGTGLSYTQKVGGKKNRPPRAASGAASAQRAAAERPPVVLQAWYIVLAVLLILGGLVNLQANWQATICGVGAGGVMLFLSIKKRRELREAAEAAQDDETSAEETYAPVQGKEQNDVTIPTRMGDCILASFYPETKIQPAEGAMEMAQAMQASGNWSLDAIATETGVDLLYQGQKFASLLERYDMVKDWLERGDPLLIYLGNLGDSGDYATIAFYRDEQKRLAHREQQVVRLTAYASEDHQDAIFARDVGDKLDLEGDDPEGGVEVCYGDTLGKLPKAIATRYIEEGCAGVFLDHVDYDEEKDKYIPYVKIYW